jgi:hypothetical protein
VLTQIPRRLGRIELKIHLMPTVCMLCIRVKGGVLDQKKSRIRLRECGQ